MVGGPRRPVGSHVPPEEEFLALRRFQVGSWLVEPEVNRVSKDETTVQLEPRVMEVLLHLIANAGSVCFKDDIIREVWADTFVTDEALWHCISQLRKAFQDSARQPSYIETVYKRGYRLLAEVAIVGHSESAPVALDSLRWLWGRATVAAVLMVAVVGIIHFHPSRANFQRSDRLVTTPLTSSSGQEIDPAISPDGRQLAYAWNQGTGQDYDIYLQLVGQNDPFRLTDSPAKWRAVRPLSDGR